MKSAAVAKKKKRTRTKKPRVGTRQKSPKDKSLAVPKKSCFVISPIGDSESRTRKHADDVYDKLIAPALQSLQYEPKRIDHLFPNGDINEAVVTEIANAPLCVVVLTELNANVMYETGVRQAWNLPLVLLAKEGTKLPFDIITRNTVFYSLATEQSIDEAVARLRTQVEHAERDSTNDIFARTVEALGDRYSLHGAFKAKHNTMVALCENLRVIKGEINSDFEKGREGSHPLQAFAGRIEQEFKSLRIKVDTLELIASAQERTNAPRQGCKNLLHRIRESQKDGVALYKLLSSEKNDDETFEEVNSLIDKIVSDAEAIRKDCDPNLALRTEI